MLGKLIKHEFKSTGKVLVPVVLILIAITLLGSILLGTKLLHHDAMIFVSIILLATYILVVIALSIITTVFLIVHYYRSMFSAQGYLTFTLPASPWAIFNAKFIVGIAWMLIISILTTLSMLVLTGMATGFDAMTSGFYDLFMSDVFVGYTVDNMSYSMSFLDLMGYTPLQFGLLTVVMSLAACFYSIATGFGAITIGQLYAKHKVIGAILAYIAIYFIMQTVLFIVIIYISMRIVFSSIMAESAEAMMTEMMQSIYQPMFNSITIIYLVAGIICYVASLIIIKKKVNLD